MLHEISRLTGFWVMHQADPKSSPVSSDVFRAAAARFWGSEQAWDLTTHEGKAQAAAKIMDRTFVKDSLLLCDSAAADGFLEYARPRWRSGIGKSSIHRSDRN